MGKITIASFRFGKMWKICDTFRRWPASFDAQSLSYLIPRSAHDRVSIVIIIIFSGARKSERDVHFFSSNHIFLMTYQNLYSIFVIFLSIFIHLLPHFKAVIKLSLQPLEIHEKNSISTITIRFPFMSNDSVVNDRLMWIWRRFRLFPCR